MTVEQVNKIIEREIKASGGVRALGRKWGVKPTQISHCMNGRRRPSKDILAVLGLEKHTTYRKIKGETQ